MDKNEELLGDQDGHRKSSGSGSDPSLKNVEKEDPTPKYSDWLIGSRGIPVES